MAPKTAIVHFFRQKEKGKLLKTEPDKNISLLLASSIGIHMLFLVIMGMVLSSLTDVFQLRLPLISENNVIGQAKCNFIPLMKNLIC